MKKICTILLYLFLFTSLTQIGVCGGKGKPAKDNTSNNADIKLEADYILSCQYINPDDPAHGAINDIYGNPTWVVPRENALAILGLIQASSALGDPVYLDRAQLAADYLVSIQDSLDGGWFDQYLYDTPSSFSKSTTQTAEVMIALYKLGEQPERYDAMKKGAEFLLSLQNIDNKGGNDDGLLGGGKDEQGGFYSWRWASDNSFAYWALKMAESWAINQNDLSFAQICSTAAGEIITGINTNLYIQEVTDPDYGVWRRVVDEYDIPVVTEFHDWINYAPQMLDLPVEGVGSRAVGNWIHNTFQESDGACIWNDGLESERKSPGYSFQASLCWLDLKQKQYANSAWEWAAGSGLWQKTEDPNGIAGGWIDWTEPNNSAGWWLRFIDTSFYAISVKQGGYFFGID